MPALPQPQALIRAAFRDRMAEVIARGVAHDLRNAAQMVGMVHQSLQGDPSLSRAMGEAMGAAHDTVMRQIAALEAFTRRERDRPAPLAVADLVADAVALISRRRGGARLEFEIDVPRTLPPVTGVTLDLSEALFALLINAWEAMLDRETGTVRLLGTATDDGVQLIVEDDGPGIAAMYETLLFEPFALRRDGGGHLGIGLAVARDLMRENGGELLFQPTTHDGARFVLHFKRWKAGQAFGG